MTSTHRPSGRAPSTATVGARIAYLSTRRERRRMTGDDCEYPPDRRHRATSTSARATYWIFSSDSRLENGKASVATAIRSVTGEVARLERRHSERGPPAVRPWRSISGCSRTT